MNPNRIITGLCVSGKVDHPVKHLCLTCSAYVKKGKSCSYYGMKVPGVKNIPTMGPLVNFTRDNNLTIFGSIYGCEVYSKKAIWGDIVL